MQPTALADTKPFIDDLLRRLTLAVEETGETFELTVIESGESAVISGDLVTRATYADARGAASGAPREHDVGPCAYFVNAVQIANGCTTKLGATRVRLADVSAWMLGRALTRPLREFMSERR